MNLAPCPHCGPRMVDPEWYQPDYDLIEDKSYWVVACGGCGSRSGMCKTAEQAITLWNKSYQKMSIQLLLMIVDTEIDIKHLSPNFVDAIDNLRKAIGDE